MLQGLPQAVAEAFDARRVYGHEQEGTLPGGELICDDVQVSINSNSFEDIMDAVRQEKNYAGISAEDAMHCVPRGLALHPSKPGWLTCRHCRRNGKPLEFPNDFGVIQHFARGGIHNPAPAPPPPNTAETAAAGAPPPTPEQDAFPPVGSTVWSRNAPYFSGASGYHFTPAEPRAATTSQSAAPSVVPSPPKAKAPPPHIREASRESPSSFPASPAFLG